MSLSTSATYNLFRSVTKVLKETAEDERQRQVDADYERLVDSTANRVLAEIQQVMQGNDTSSSKLAQIVDILELERDWDEDDENGGEGKGRDKTVDLSKSSDVNTRPVMNRKV